MHLWRPQQVAAAPKKRNFLIYVAQDVSDDYAADVLSNWLRYRDLLQAGRVTGLTAAIVLDECVPGWRRFAPV